MNKKIIITILVVLVVAVGGYILLNNYNQPSSLVMNEQESQEQQVNQSDLEVNAGDVQVTIETAKTYEVIYTDSGFSPSPLAIKVGDTVIFKNQNSSGMWVASGQHPAHTAYSGTSLGEHCPDTANVAFDECKSAQSQESWSFTFQKQGTWGYHNHVNASHFGKITVE